MGDASVFTRATGFIWGNARLLERRVFESRFQGAGPEAVVAALRAYQNPDGGFGHALEPDLRAPGSQPIHVELALRTLHEVGARDAEMARRACDFLDGVATPEGAVPAILASALDHPRAAHWNGPFGLAPGPNPTLGVAGLLHGQGVRHRWLDRATAYGFDRLATQPVKDAHTLLGAVAFLTHVPDRERADAVLPRVLEQILHADFFNLEPGVRTYGLTPLHFAPAPDATCRRLFSKELIEAHLDDLVSRQQPDGGWPISWEAPGAAATSEWRGRWTLDALAALHAYGRIVA